MDTCHKWLGFLFGIFLILFTFVNWAPAKWFFFGIGVVLVLHAFIGEKCFEVKKPIKKK